MNYSYLDVHNLATHDEDPESRNHNVKPGTWEHATCAESDEARESHEVNVWSSLSDPSGEFGEPQMFTEWGTKDGRTPVVADIRYMDEGKTCEHRVYRIEA